jgi:hypothetical protein
MRPNSDYPTATRPLCATAARSKLASRLFTTTHLTAQPMEYCRRSETYGTFIFSNDYDTYSPCF